MIGMGFAMDVFAMAPDVPVLWSPAGLGEDESEPVGAAEEVVLFRMGRRGVMPTASGPLRVAVQVQVQRSDRGRLTAVMVVATLAGQARWALRRVSVPIQAGCSKAAAEALRLLLPDMLRDGPDGTTMLAGPDGVVEAEVVAVSGLIASAQRQACEPRRPMPRVRIEPRRRPPAWTWPGRMQQCQPA